MQLTDRNEIPQSILDIYAQVGGNRAMNMAFSAWSYSSKDTSATFTVAPALRRSVPGGVTHVRVTLAPSDTYLVEFLRVSTPRPAGVEIARDENVYAEDLRRWIESRTGLTLSLGTMGSHLARAS